MVYCGQQVFSIIGLYKNRPDLKLMVFVKLIN